MRGNKLRLQLSRFRNTLNQVLGKANPTWLPPTTFLLKPMQMIGGLMQREGLRGGYYAADSVLHLIDKCDIFPNPGHICALPFMLQETPGV